MVTVTIGDVVGMSHDTPYTLDGRPVLCHRPHRAVTTQTWPVLAMFGSVTCFNVETLVAGAFPAPVASAHRAWAGGRSA